MKNNKQDKDKISKLPLLFAVALVYLLAIVMYAQGVPSGATLTSNTTDTGPTIAPMNRSDDGGTITTLVLDSTQQNAGWKAYVGNVTGTLTLDDSNSQTIYDWPLGTTITGEIYVSRNGTINWGVSIQCANDTVVSTEQSFIGGADTDSDSINNTYNYSAHETMQVGVTTITNSTCKTTYTHQNDAFPASPGEGTNFTAILLQDSSASLIYASDLEQNAEGFNGNNQDFQILVPDNSTGAVVTYYFYLEIGS